ncbi:MAG TPA: MFS transporter, partial [Spirochaetia bacterium]|nr:MFS transporter [Spirochaetia bacterium]
MKLWQRNLTVSWITQIISLTGFNFVLPFLPYYIQELGVKSTVELNTWVGLISSAPALLMGIMAPIWGFLADKLGRKLMILRAMLGGSIIISLMGVARNVETVFILRCLQGLFTGSITASATLIAAGTPDDKLSFSLGFLSSSNFIGLSIGPLIGGLLAEFLGFRTTIFSGAALIFVGFLMVLFFIREAETTPSKTMPKQEHFSVKHIMRQ